MIYEKKPDLCLRGYVPLEESQVSPGCNDRVNFAANSSQKAHLFENTNLHKQEKEGKNYFVFIFPSTIIHLNI